MQGGAGAGAGQFILRHTGETGDSDTVQRGVLLDGHVLCPQGTTEGRWFAKRAVGRYKHGWTFSAIASNETRPLGGEPVAQRHAANAEGSEQQLKCSHDVLQA